MPKTREAIAEWLRENEPDTEFMLADGLDEAFIGIGRRAANMHPVTVYDTRKIIEILVVRDGMTHEEACEWFDYNIIAAYVGEGTPIFVEVMLDG